MVNELDRQIKKSYHQGAKILTGGKRIDIPGFYYQPTVLTNITMNMPVMKEETFGPVAPLFIVEDEMQALNAANESCYGLGASIWTKNIDKAKTMAYKIQSGNVFINEIVKSDPKLPFGGIKQSGFGRELSQYGLKEFVNVQTVYIKKH